MQIIVTGTLHLPHSQCHSSLLWFFSHGSYCFFEPVSTFFHPFNCSFFFFFSTSSHPLLLLFLPVSSVFLSLFEIFILDFSVSTSGLLLLFSNSLTDNYFPFFKTLNAFVFIAQQIFNRIKRFNALLIIQIVTFLEKSHFEISKLQKKKKTRFDLYTMFLLGWGFDCTVKAFW